MKNFQPKMLYDFLGFEKHVRQIRERRGAQVPDHWYKRPAYYIGSVAPDKIFRDGETVTIPRFIEKPDYETEFALVVQKNGKPKTIAEAADFIINHCAFTLFNDWSARDVQVVDMAMGMSVSHSKTVIGSSFGPQLVAAKEFSFDAEGVPSIAIETKVNGEVRCRGNYNSVYWSFAKILAFLGKENISVWPGDVLGSGTVGDGCIAEFAAKTVDGKEVEPAKYPWLQSGDVVEITAEKIGTLKNKVVIA